MLKKKENKHNKERGGRVHKVKHEQEMSASSSSQNAIRCKIFLKQGERLKKKESLDMKTIILYTKLMDVFILFLEIDNQSWLEQLSLQWFQFLGYSRLSVRFFDAPIGKDRARSWLQCSCSLSMWSTQKTQTIDFRFILYRFARMVKHA